MKITINLELEVFVIQDKSEFVEIKNTPLLIISQKGDIEESMLNSRGETEHNSYKHPILIDSVDFVQEVKEAVENTVVVYEHTEINKIIKLKHIGKVKYLFDMGFTCSIIDDTDNDRIFVFVQAIDSILEYKYDITQKVESALQGIMNIPGGTAISNAKMASRIIWETGIATVYNEFLKNKLIFPPAFSVLKK